MSPGKLVAWAEVRRVVCKTRREMKLNKLLGLRGFAWGMRMDRLRKSVLCGVREVWEWQSTVGRRSQRRTGICESLPGEWVRLPERATVQRNRGQDVVGLPEYISRSKG